MSEDMDSEFELKPELEANIDGFSFGCVVDQTFVYHFKSTSKPSIHYSKILFSNYKQRLLIQFVNFSQIDVSSESQQWFDEKFEFAINYSNIKSIHINDNQMVIKLTFPPLFYTICYDVNDFYYIKETIDDINGIDSGFDDLPIDIEDNESLICSEVSDNFNELDTNYGFCGFRLRITRFDEMEDVFTKTNSIHFIFKDKTCFTDIIANLKAFEPNIVFEENGFETKECESVPNDSSLYLDLPFPIRYSLEALTNHSFQIIDSLQHFGHTFTQFVDLIKSLSEINEKCVENSLSDLRLKIESNSDVRPMAELQESFNNYLKEIPKKWTNKSVLKIRRCILTPTRILLLPALPLQESRFLRTTDPEFVIRVLIKDEDFQLLSFTTCKSSLYEDHPIMDEIRCLLYNKIVKRLSNGIQIAGRTYQLVGASTSQLRDHGLVLYACDDHQRNAFSIRKEIGEIDCLRNAGKFIARIGQSMSQSMGFISNVDCIEMIDDITGGVHPKTGKTYIFSDGVGMISELMAKELCDTLGIRSTSAYQIRYAGFKGVLVVNPELKGRKIVMRPSMKKFESNSKDLDVLKVSEARSCYLNRPLITILNQMGVTNDHFLELLYKRQQQLADAFECESKAIQLIKEYSGYDFGFDVLLNSGINILKEPFFVKIIQSIITKVSLDLKNKARILIPFDSGRVMYGVLDETRTLKYGQVFVQYTHRGAKRLLKGEVLVTKYPCMHAGDVRKLQAIDVKALHHIVDCIVFPANGERPHPDEMAGSDLDGDEYSVIWYKPMIFEKKNCDPMYFPSGEAEDLGRPVTNEDILNFYCRFINHNQVGLIAHSHLVWADTTLYGIRSRLCEDLAGKYAVALDYAKTGINARLRNEQKPLLYPDFMMKSNEKPTYKSSNALGKLFQKNCYFHELINEFTEENIGFELNSFLDHKNAFIHIESAKHSFKLYENSIKELMENFGIESESSLISSTFNRTHKYVCTSYNDNKDTYDLITNIIRKLFNDFLNNFKSGITDEDILLAKASAWYKVSHEANGRKSGFPWIVSKYLAKLAQKNGSKKHECLHISKVCDQFFPKEIIVNIFNQFIMNSMKKNIIGFNSEISEKEIHKRVENVLQKYESVNEINLSVLMELFSEFTNNFKDISKEYNIAIIALMAKMKIKRLGYFGALKYQLNSKENKTKNCVSVKVMAISEKVADIFKYDDNFEDPNKSLISIVKALTGVSQIVFNYGLQGHESNVCVYGNNRSLKMFEQFITEKTIDSKLKSGDFRHTFY